MRKTFSVRSHRLAATIFRFGISSVMVCCGLFVAPELRRSVAEEVIRELLGHRDRGAEGDMIHRLIKQTMTPPTRIERFFAHLFRRPHEGRSDYLEPLGEILTDGITKGVDKSARRAAEFLISQAEKGSPSVPPTDAESQLARTTATLLETDQRRQRIVQELSFLKAEIAPLEEKCRKIRNEVTTALGLTSGAGRSQGSYSLCEQYGSGPLRSLPKIAFLRGDLISEDALIQSLRAAGSTLPLENGGALDQLQPLVARFQRNMAAILPDVSEAMARRSKLEEAQRRLASEHFIHQERFLRSVLLTIQTERCQEIHAPLTAFYRTIAKAAVRAVAS